MKLVGRHPGRYQVNDLGRDVWNPNGNSIDPDNNVVQRAISAIRTVLRPLGVTVEHARGLGYVLAESHRSAAKASGNKRREVPPRRARTR
jgi:hypothetical protein